MPGRNPGPGSLPIVLGALIVAGAVLRMASGDSVLITDLVYRTGPSGGKARYPGNRTPENALTTFYLAIDSGDYERAYGVLLEPDWTAANKPVPYREAVAASPEGFRSWTTEEEFLIRMKSEIGIRGSGITLNSVEARIVEPLDPARYRDTYGISDVGDAFLVEARGNILGACSIFTWRKNLEVLEIGKRYRVLLSGTKEGPGFFYQSWFADVERIGNLRAGGGT
jgi:hypothetical protein